MLDLLANALPEPHTILGVRLRPLSVGHLLYLSRFGISDVDDAGKLITALLVCSRRVEDIQPALEDPLLDLKLNVWLWRASNKRWLTLWRRGGIDWREKYARWDAYYAAHTRIPTTATRREGAGFQSNVPFLQHLKVTLQSKLNYSPSEALDCPFSVAVLDYYTLHEIEGAIEILDPEKRKAARKEADDRSEEWIAEARRMKEARR